jgi:hypothetical protein
VIRRAAREVVDRMGSTAIDYMQNRISAFELDGTPQERDQAYRLLTAVEQIVEERTS